MDSPRNVQWGRSLGFRLDNNRKELAMKEIWLFLCACAILLGCSEVVPGTCYPNPAGGAGGGGSVPTTTVGATSGTGDFPAYPENEPLDIGDGAYEACVDDDPCVCQVGGWKRYSPQLFNFATVIQDDGNGPSGGWQEAHVALNVNIIHYTPFLHIEPWKCAPVTFGAPLRNKDQGVISPQRAATLCANLASSIADALMEDKNMTEGIYCFKLKNRLSAEIGGVIFGATVQQK
jgi:hypothetical protein